MAKPYEIIIRPLLTEKSTTLQETQNQVSFEVSAGANRLEIKKEVEKVFPNVKVLDVRTLNVRGKMRRMGRHMGKKPNWKKAMVTLREGDQIEFFEGV